MIKSEFVSKKLKSLGMVIIKGQSNSFLISNILLNTGLSTKNESVKTTENS